MTTGKGENGTVGRMQRVNHRRNLERRQRSVEGTEKVERKDSCEMPETPEIKKARISAGARPHRKVRCGI